MPDQYPKAAPIDCASVQNRLIKERTRYASNHRRGIVIIKRERPTVLLCTENKIAPYSNAKSTAIVTIVPKIGFVWKNRKVRQTLNTKKKPITTGKTPI